MEEFKKKIRQRVALLCILLAVGACLSIFDVFFAPEELKNSYVFGFQTGAVTALTMLAVVLVINYGVVLRDEKKLRRLFNRESDERYKAIRAKAGMPVLLFTAVGMIVSGVIAGYFNFTVFVTLIAAGAAQILVGAALKSYYLHKM